MSGYEAESLLGIYFGRLVFTIIFSVCLDDRYSGISTVSDSKTICVGTSYYDVAYTIRGNEICKGTSYFNVAYTIRKNN